MAFPGSKLRIEAIQSVMPMNQTDPRDSYLVSVHESQFSGTFDRHFQMVMCYNKGVQEEDSGWRTAGWIKDSLGTALAEQPAFAGRLRRGEGGNLEIVTNDSGVRLVEASIEMDLSEFLDLKQVGEAETQLAYWENINPQNPEFFPLFYVQVTNFKCGGFSIGISCSLLVADPFSLQTFLNRWSRIHKTKVSGADSPKLPIFYLPNLKKTGTHPLPPSDTTTETKPGQSMMFNIAHESLATGSTFEDKKLAALCIAKAEGMLGRRIDASVSLWVKGPSGDVKIENFSRKPIDEKECRAVPGLDTASWADLALENINLIEGNKPSSVMSWINSVHEESFVMIIPDSEDDSGMKIIVTVPRDEA